MLPLKMRCLSHLSLLWLTAGKVYFKEQFHPGWETRWVKSKAAGAKQGAFTLNAGRWFHDEEEDKGLMTYQDAKWFQISAQFPPFSNEGKTLIIQWTLKYIKPLEPCGGGYIKLGEAMKDPLKFDQDTPYNIMVGPDQCGYDHETHLIFQYKGRNIKKKHDLSFRQSELQITRLYRLTLRPNNTVALDVDGKHLYDGLIQKDWDILEPKWIPDRNDRKPENWHDQAMMEEPGQKEPEWWVDEEFKHILDPKSVMPSDWDAEVDGDWVQAKMDNPKYHGKWEPHKIFNPQYDGFWEPRKIANPKYRDDEKLYVYNFGWIGIDLWQDSGGSIFDNIIITDEVAEADKLAHLWARLQQAEYTKRFQQAKASAHALRLEEADHDYDDDLSEIDHDPNPPHARHDLEDKKVIKGAKKGDGPSVDDL